MGVKYTKPPSRWVTVHLGYMYAVYIGLEILPNVNYIGILGFIICDFNYKWMNWMIFLDHQVETSAYQKKMSKLLGSRHEPIKIYNIYVTSGFWTFIVVISFLLAPLFSKSQNETCSVVETQQSTRLRKSHPSKSRSVCWGWHTDPGGPMEVIGSLPGTPRPSRFVMVVSINWMIHQIM